MMSSNYRKPDTVEGLTDDVLSRLSAFISAQMGLHFPKKKWRDLERGISAAAREFGFDEAGTCIRWIMSSPLSKEQVEVLASHLTVGETYFLRDARGLEILKGNILPRLISSRRGDAPRLRIWSAGCSSGEEPFSIAILLNDMGAAVRNWNISILATDINPLALRKAAEGIYRDWSFRNTPRGFREKHFTRTGDGRFRLLPHIRKMVNFSYLNLAEDSYPSLLNDTNAMDVIFCRNLLMYFSAEKAGQVIDRLHRSLVHGGWLIVSPCEVSLPLFSQFKAVSYPDAILYRKGCVGETDYGHLKTFLPGLPASGVQASPSVCRFPPPSCPNAILPPYEQALTLYEQGLYPEAEHLLASCMSSAKEDVRATLLLCRVLANQGKLDEARQMLEQAIAAHRLDAELYYHLAMIIQEQGNLEQAAELLKRAIYLDQDMVLAHFSLANLALRQGRSSEARRHYANTVSLLGRYRREDAIPVSEGMSAGRLLEIIKTMGMVEDRDEERRFDVR